MHVSYFFVAIKYQMLDIPGTMFRTTHTHIWENPQNLDWRFAFSYSAASLCMSPKPSSHPQCLSASPGCPSSSPLTLSLAGWLSVSPPSSLLSPCSVVPHALLLLPHIWSPVISGCLAVFSLYLLSSVNTVLFFTWEGFLRIQKNRARTLTNQQSLGR